MSLDWFFKLREIDSLTKMQFSQLKFKSDQESRLSKLSDIRTEKLSAIDQLQQRHIQLKNDLAQLEKDIKIASTQKHRLLDIGGEESKIALFQETISNLEDKGFGLLGEEEELVGTLEEIKNFLTGLNKTYFEIEAEVNSEILQTQNELQNIKTRLDLLIQELPEEFKALLLKTMGKNLAHGPFTRIEQGSCYFCRFKISRLEESEIDQQQRLKTCAQCGRIFIPFGA